MKRWSCLILGAVTACLGLAAGAASPAAADEISAMNRCTQGQIPSHDSPHVTVLGNGGGSDPGGPNPGNILERGDAFVIVPDFTTRVSVDHWGQNHGPNGNGVLARDGNWPFLGLNQFSAVLRFNNNSGGWVGAPVAATAFNRCTTWQSNFPVRLLFGVNDPGPGDNGGAWKFRVMIYKASAPNSTAMDRCSRGLSADPGSQLVTVRGNGGGTVPSGPNPGNIIKRGDVIRIVPHYTSYATMDYWGTWFGPDGNGLAAPASWPFPGLNQFSPILRFNNNPAGWVGQPAQATAFGGCTTWQSSFSVRLLFGVNDPDVSDNGLGWRFDVLIYRA